MGTTGVELASIWVEDRPRGRSNLRRLAQARITGCTISARRRAFAGRLNGEAGKGSSAGKSSIEEAHIFGYSRGFFRCSIRLFVQGSKLDSDVGRGSSLEQFSDVLRQAEEEEAAELASS